MVVFALNLNEEILWVNLAGGHSLSDDSNLRRLP